MVAAKENGDVSEDGEEDDVEEDQVIDNLTHGGGKGSKTLRSITCRHLHLVALWKRNSLRIVKIEEKTCW